MSAMTTADGTEFHVEALRPRRVCHAGKLAWILRRDNPGAMDRSTEWQPSGSVMWTE
jgi:hypothetical protein